LFFWFRTLSKLNKELPGKVPRTWAELKAVGGIPKSLHHLDNNTQFLRFYGPVEEGELETMAIFASDTGLEILGKAKILAMDGTFLTSPRPFTQLFVIQVNICLAVRGGGLFHAK